MSDYDNWRLASPPRYDDPLPLADDTDDALFQEIQHYMNGEQLALPPHEEPNDDRQRPDPRIDETTPKSTNPNP